MDYEEPTCATCKYRKTLKKYDYTQGGCKHTEMEGFACIADSFEGLIIWMVGTENGGCECYERRKENPCLL